jgi:tetratricopeptide (TPR) repeat protein
LKINSFRPLYSIGIILFLVACSTKNNSFLSRNSHALSTEYNILYNGQIGLDKGIESIKTNNVDNFWKRLPIERMQLNDEIAVEGKSKNTNFELAETKATKAIQKHSMNIGGLERNSQIDEAYLLLGKSRYYDQRFLPALDAFNYILYKYPNSSRIYEAKIWREKTNMRLGNDALVVKNISKLLKDKELNNQVFANANALLSEAFLNLEEKDSAVIKLKIAEKFTKINSERARYRFILGQLYQELGKNDSAIYSYQSVIDMNRKADRKYLIQAYAKKAQLFDYKNGDTTAFLKKYNKLIVDRENRPFLDVIYREMGVFYDKNNKQKEASFFYNTSLKKATSDQYLIASNYRDLGNMHFKNTNYPVAAKYYDSTLVKLDSKTREYVRIQKIRKNLDEVIGLEAIAKRNDSVLSIVSLAENDRVLYFENYIDKLKKTDEAKRVFEEKLKKKQENIDRNSKSSASNPTSATQEPDKLERSSALPPSDATAKPTTNTFYFYNPTTIAFGKLEFKKIWGDRSPNGNWRLSTKKTDLVVNDSIAGDKTILDNNLATTQTDEKYTSEYYLKQLPTEQKVIDSMAKERNATYYELGVIYKEKFKEYELATAKLEQLLKNNPEEKLVLPTLYNLFKIYQITDATKAEALKSRISAEFPDSRYAQIINNTNSNVVSDSASSEKEYEKWYDLFDKQHFTIILEHIDGLINKFSGDAIVPKYELLKANTIAKLKGLSAYKVALQELADNYPNSEEGKNAQEILTTQIPFLEQTAFNTKDTKNWKILYIVANLDGQTTYTIEEKIHAFLVEEKDKNLFYSCDSYTEKESFISIHGINSEVYAKNIVQRLQEDKKYKITAIAVVISNENYKVIQIKKNLETYLSPKL